MHWIKIRLFLSTTEILFAFFLVTKAKHETSQFTVMIKSQPVVGHILITNVIHLYNHVRQHRIKVVHKTQKKAFREISWRQIVTIFTFFHLHFFMCFYALDFKGNGRQQRTNSLKATLEKEMLNQSYHVNIQKPMKHVKLFYFSFSETKIKPKLSSVW